MDQLLIRYAADHMHEIPPLEPGGPSSAKGRGAATAPELDDVPNDSSNSHDGRD